MQPRSWTLFLIWNWKLGRINNADACFQKSLNCLEVAHALDLP